MKTEMIVAFPKFSGVRCLMMPYVQGEPLSVPEQYRGYADSNHRYECAECGLELAPPDEGGPR